jgi:hypothetical protein
MNKMPLDAHKKQNDTIHSRMVRRARPFSNNSITVTPGGAASTAALAGAAVGAAPPASAWRSISATVLSAAAVSPRLS